MKHQVKLVIALCLAPILTISATWAFAMGGGNSKTDQVLGDTTNVIFLFAAAASPNGGDKCTNFSGGSFSCDLPTANSSTSLPRAGSLQSLIVHPAYNTVKTDIVVAVFVNHVPTALFTVIPAGNTRSHIIHANVDVSAGDLVQIVTQGFTSENEAESLQYSGSVVYQYP